MVADPAPADLPETLAGQPLAQAVYGRQAADEIFELHRKTLPLTSAAVGIYGPNGEITLWVSGAGVPILAARMIDTMRERIAANPAVFQPLGRRQVGGRQVEELSGMGQRHYYFQSGSLVIWLAAPAELAEIALQETLAFYP
jgi:hypothetical protein